MALKLYVAGTFDTKSAELFYIRDCLQAALANNTLATNISVVTLDLAAKYENRARAISPADVAPEEVAAFHPQQLSHSEIFTPDRGQAISQILQAFSAYIVAQNAEQPIAGIIGAGGSGGSALLAPAMRALPIGVPKLLVSTVASGNTQPYVGASDLTLMYSVADIAGLNAITRQVLGNAAHAMAGMAQSAVVLPANTKPALGLTMFGVTTPCVEAVRAQLCADYDCLIFHATGSGGQAMEKLAASGQLAGVLDITTTEIADHLFGGVFSAGAARLDAIINSGIPYVGSVGALDMVNFGARNTVPSHYQHRLLHIHNPQVTLMRTNATENAQIGQWIAHKLNQCQGPVRFLLPEKGVSFIATQGQVFYDPEADNALFNALEEHLITTPKRQLIRLPYAINDPQFSQALLEHFFDITHP